MQEDTGPSKARGPELGSGARAGMQKWYRGGFGGSWWLDGGEGEREGCQQGGGDGTIYRFRGHRKRSGSGVGGSGEMSSSPH